MKKYKTQTIEEIAIDALIDAGYKVTAINGKISELQLEDNVDIKDVEQLTGLKFKEKEAFG